MNSSGQKIINPIKKVIIDSDAGIDDAMAIMLALSGHRKQTVEVVAITLVGGNSDTDNAKVNILRVLETYGLEDEVYFTKHHYYIGTRLLIIQLSNNYTYHSIFYYIFPFLRSPFMLEQMMDWLKSINTSELPFMERMGLVTPNLISSQIFQKFEQMNLLVLRC